MKRNFLVLAFLIGLIPCLLGQTNQVEIKVRDFEGHLAFLSSGWFEGRETGENGGYMAADYIASQMNRMGLLPIGDRVTYQSGQTGLLKVPLVGSDQVYNQFFPLERYGAGVASLGLEIAKGGQSIRYLLKDSTDFRFVIRSGSFELDASPVFVGYGVASEELGYDDYKGVDVRGKVVVLISGFPGQDDVNSLAWKKVGSVLERKGFSNEEKAQIALKNGASMVIEVRNPLIKSSSQMPLTGTAIKPLSIYADGVSDEPYSDLEFCFPNSGDSEIPWAKLNRYWASRLFGQGETRLEDWILQNDKSARSSSFVFNDTRIFSKYEVRKSNIMVSNLLGMIKGEDTTKTIVIGAHYDHLGRRGDDIYYGSDDNASGTAGMLSLAEYWSKRDAKPKYNLLFAAWTGEEKGKLGSKWFVKELKSLRSEIILYMNFDMISRSSPFDVDCDSISVGIPQNCTNLKTQVGRLNAQIATPFKLDQWNSGAHGGSDYAPFIGAGVPAVAFFSGFHADYHTPADRFYKADLTKMNRIINLANQIIIWALENQKEIGKP